MKTITIQVKPEDFINTSYMNTTGCALYKAIKRNGSFSDKELEVGGTTINVDGINDCYKFSTSDGLNIKRGYTGGSQEFKVTLIKK